MTPTAPTPAPPRPRRSRWRSPWLWLILLALLLLLGGGAAVWQAAAGANGGAATPAPTPAPLTVRGRLVPVQQARIGTLAGGVVARLTVRPGDRVSEGQEIARLRGPAGTPEVVTAPWSGTILSVPASLGDTIMAGGEIAALGDLSRLQVETTDVDEFIINQVRREQRVTVLVDALDRREVPGFVATVALQPVATAAGDEHYPVTIALLEQPAGLRPGMSVRVIVPESTE
jgi:multidrug efflux pump subunit AcrA (membrane-fusion protein)